MKIAIDYSWLGPTGIGRVASEVIDRAPAAWQIQGVREGKRNAGPLTPLDLWWTLRSRSADLFWSPGFMPSLSAAKMPIVLTVHDLTHLHYYGKSKRAYYDLLIRPLFHRMQHIVTVSDFTRRELLLWSGLPDDKVTLIPNGVSPDFTAAGSRLGVERPYILYAGNRRSYKNVPKLMQAFSMSGLAKKGYVLGLTGTRTADYAQLESEYGLTGDVKYFGFVPDETLPELYRSAHAVVFVSLYEGFGLPIIEGMASGVPVLTSNVSSMPEVAGDAALLVDPHSVSSIAEGLRQIAEDGVCRKELIARGSVRAAEFTWDRTASGYWNLFSRLLRKG